MADKKLFSNTLSRRRMLGLMGATAVAVVVGCDDSDGSNDATPNPTQSSTPSGTAAGNGAATASATPAASCVVTPALTEGPYFVDERLNRSDIRTDTATGAASQGLPLRLVISVLRYEGNSCMPLSGAVVDVWHCDAAGVYSDVQDPMFSTLGKNFLRGYQVTDANGRAEFTTVYPGWYMGRAVHIHFKVRTDPDSELGTEFTSQFFMDESITDEVHVQAPYSAKGQRNLRNEGDGIYRQGGSQMLLALTKDSQGYVGTYNVGLQMS